MELSEWLEKNYPNEEGWKLDENGDLNNQDIFDHLYEEYCEEQEDTITEEEEIAKGRLIHLIGRWTG